MQLIGRGRLIDAIEAKGISQRELARMAGCDDSFINHLTSGRRRSCTPQLAERICLVLNIPITLLFDVHSPSRTPSRRVKRTVAA